MKQKIERVYRDRYLTEEEVKHYTALRRTVEEEFGAPHVDSPTVGGVLTEELRSAIRGSGRSIDQIAEASHVSQALIESFITGKLSISLLTADRLVQALGLHLTSVK